MSEKFKYIPIPKPSRESVHTYSKAGIAAGAVLFLVNPLVGMSVMALSGTGFVLTEKKSVRT